MGMASSMISFFSCNAEKDSYILFHYKNPQKYTFTNFYFLLEIYYFYRSFKFKNKLRTYYDAQTLLRTFSAEYEEVKGEVSIKI